MEKRRIHQPREPHFFKPVLLGSNQQLTIPKEFMDYLKEEMQVDGGEAVLKSHNLVGRSWQVKMIDGKCFGGDGWKEFARDHELNVGDLLVFRHQGGLVFTVMVFDSSACHRDYFLQDQGPKIQTDGINLHSSTSTDTSIEEEKAPYFTTTLKLSNIKYCFLHVPMAFATSNGLNGMCCIVTLRNKSGRSWMVKLRHRKDIPEVYISAGWKKFSKDNRLQMGDICTFKLISSGTKVVFDVVISLSNESQHLNDSTRNANEGGKMFDSTKRERECLQDAGGKRKPTIGQEEERGREGLHGPSSSGTSIEQEKAPYFTTMLKLINFKRCYLNIPFDFASSNGLNVGCCIITLTNEKGRCWQVQLRHNRGTPRVHISFGWRKFAKDNRLKTGDICSFRLVSKGKNVVFQVSFPLSNGSACEKDYLHDKGRTENETNRQGKQRGRIGLPGSVLSTPPFTSVNQEEEASYFTTKMNLSNISNGILLIPGKFARSNGLTNMSGVITLRNKKGGSWMVNLGYKTTETHLYLKGGWKEFSEDNMLQIGDICMFRLVSSGTKVVFEVTISETDASYHFNDLA